MSKAIWELYGSSMGKINTSVKLASGSWFIIHGSGFSVWFSIQSIIKNGVSIARRLSIAKTRENAIARRLSIAETRGKCY